MQNRSFNFVCIVHKTQKRRRQTNAEYYGNVLIVCTVEKINWLFQWFHPAMQQRIYLTNMTRNWINRYCLQVTRYLWCIIKTHVSRVTHTASIHFQSIHQKHNSQQNSAYSRCPLSVYMQTVSPASSSIMGTVTLARKLDLNSSRVAHACSNWLISPLWC